MLYGDDDTLFFPEVAAKVLQNLDPDMPYFITGIDFGLQAFSHTVSQHSWTTMTLYYRAYQSLSEMQLFEF